MTLPFENDTKTIIKRISSRNISANRKRNIFIIITITLASTLLSAITLYGFGITQKTKNLNKKTAQIVNCSTGIFFGQLGVFNCKRKIASTLTFLGGCFAATDI